MGLLGDKWYQRYVNCFATPNTFPLPDPIPEPLKAYLRGTFLVYWGWAITILGSVHCVLTAIIMCGFTATNQPLTLKFMVHSCGTVSAITTSIFLLWTVLYYSRVRDQTIMDLNYIIETRLENQV
jgi:hypothetical protein